MDDTPQPLYWEPIYEVALALKEAYPHFNIEDIGMKQLKDMIIALPNFADDASSASDELLRGILNEWYESQENT
jgi:FeS assembly protein IscX